MRQKLIFLAVFMVVLSGYGDVVAFQLDHALRTIGKDYIFLGRGSYDLELGLQYYEINSDSGLYSPKETKVYRTFSLALAYGIFDHVSVHAGIPYEYRGIENFDSLFGYYTESEEEQGIGDVSAGVTWGMTSQREPFLSHQVTLAYIFPTGNGPFDDDSEYGLYTGSGYSTLTLTYRMFKSFGSFMPYADIFYGYTMKEKYSNKPVNSDYGIALLTEHDPGDIWAIGPGITWSPFERTSFHMGYQYKKYQKSYYHFSTGTSYQDEYDSKFIRFGAGVELTQDWGIYPSIDAGLGDSYPDYILRVRVSFH